MAYRAFLSYSHAADGKLCPAIQSALHRFAKPWYQRRAIKVFRDAASLSANPALWGAIEKALAASEYFLLLASPQSAQSAWVQREVDWWIENKSIDRLLILLTQGELVWDQRAGDFDWTRTTAISERLRGRFRDEPLYVDFRWVDAPETLSLRHTQFRAAILDLSATLRAIPKDELDGEDVRQHRRTRMLAAVAVAGILTFAVVAAWQAYVANVQRRQAEHERVQAEQARAAESTQRRRADAAADDARSQRDEATRQRDLAMQREREATEQRRIATSERNTALSRLLAAQSLKTVTDPLPKLDLGLLQAVAAYRIQPTAEAQRSVVNALMVTNRVKALVHAPATLVSLALSPDGGTIAAGDTQGRVVLWDADSLKQRATFDNGKAFVQCLSFSPDGRTLAAGSADGVSLWDVRRGTKGRVLASGRTSKVMWHPDGSMVISNGTRIVAWDAGTGVERTSIAVRPLASRRLAVSPDGRTLVTAGDEPAITVWDAATGGERQRLNGHRGTVTAVAFDRTGSRLASAGDSGTIIIWDASTGTLRTTLEKHTDPVDALAFSPDGRSLASGSRNGLIILWDLASAEPSEVLSGHTNGVMEVVFSRGGAELVSAAFDRTLIVWNLGVTRHRTLLKGHTADVRQVAVSRDGALLASASEDATIRLWDVVTAKERFVLKGHRGEVRAIALSPAAPVLASGGEDRRIRFWDTASGRPLTETDGHGQITALAFSPDGATLAWAAEGTSPIFVWDVAAGREVRELAGHDTNAVTLEFSRDGKVLVSGGGETIRFWDPSGGREIAQPLRVGTALKAVISPDGGMVASSQTYPSEVLLWDLRSDADPVRLPALNMMTNNIPTFSPDGSTLAHTSGQFRTDVVLVNLRTRLPAWTLETHATVLSLAFTPDGKRLVTGHSNGHVAVWDADVQSWPGYACQLANRNLTRDEWRTFVGGQVPYQVLCPGHAVAER